MKKGEVYQKPLEEAGRVVVEAIKKAFLKSKKTAPLANYVVLERVKTPPCGQVILLKIGFMGGKYGVFPSQKDLCTARDATMRAANKHMRTARATDRAYPTEWLFFPPIISFNVTGSMKNPKVVVLLGLEDIRPSKPDLENTRQLVVPMFKRLGIAAKNVIIKPF